jgi:hypothetical protein
MAELVGPLNGDSSLIGYDQTWSDSSDADFPHTMSISQSKWESPSEIDDPLHIDYPDRWELLCKPLRHRVTNFDLTPGETTSPRIYAAETAQDKRPTTHIGAIPSGSHCGELRLSTLELPVLTVIDDQSGDPLPFRDGGSEIVAVRVLINGVDVTGVMPVQGGSFTRYINDLNGSVSGGMLVALPEAVTVTGRPTIEWDVWLRIKLQGDYIGGDVVPFVAMRTHPQSRYLSPFYGDRINFLFGAIAGADANYRQLNQRLHWRLQLPANSEYLFNGTSRTLRLEPQDGWSYVDDFAAVNANGQNLPPTEINMIDSRGDQIIFRWRLELPEIELTVISGGPGASYRVRFQIFGNSYDAYEWGRQGVWNPWRRARFTLQGEESSQVEVGSTQRWWSSFAVPGMSEQTRFNAAPRTLTLTPYQKRRI